MFRAFLLLYCLLTIHLLPAQYDYNSSPEHPYGQYNPKAPAALQDFAPLIGTCDCTSTSRLPDGTWADPVQMTWTFRYIMNGMAIQDETLKEDGKHSGSIRIYDDQKETWLIHYYTSSAPTGTALPFWTGGKADNKLVFLREQKAPNGAPGDFRLTFYEISTDGYRWVGEWVSADKSIVYPTWKIDCQR